MRIAVVGAGIVGITTAYELASDGHEVTLFERRTTVAAESSFANAGVIAPGAVTPWAAPGMPGKVIRHLFEAHAPVRISWPLGPGVARWMWRWWRACDAATHQANRTRMHRLAHYSRQRLHLLAHKLSLEYEQSHGYLVLLRTERDLALARASLKLLAELGVTVHLVDGQRAREIEPGLNADTPLHAAIHLPDDEVGNCRQFAQLLRNELPGLGVRVRLSRDVQAVVPGSQVQLRHRPAARGTDPVVAADEAPSADFADTTPQTEGFDHVVICAALGSKALLEPLGRRLPMVPVYGYSVTAPLRERANAIYDGPKSALMDERYKVAISRLGQRVRVAGSAELGGSPSRQNEAALATLYKVLDDWFPGCAQMAQGQTWKGARPMMPDGPPVLGPSGLAGVSLNLGHGASGWALACGSARMVADRLAARTPEIDVEGLGIERLR